MKNLLLFLAVTILLASCSAPTPEEAAILFFENISNNNIGAAKALCSPSAEKELTRLENVGAFGKNVFAGTKYQLMDIVSPEKPQNGDTVTVSYNVQTDYENYILLVFNEKRWEVAFDDKLKQITCMGWSSSEFLQEVDKNDKLFLENYEDCLFQITDLTFAYFRDVDDKRIWYAYNPSTSEIYTFNKVPGFSYYPSYFIGDKELKAFDDGEYPFKQENGYTFYFNKLSESDNVKIKEPEVKLTKKKIVDMFFEDEYYDVKINTVAQLRGVLHNLDFTYSRDYIVFDQSKLIE
jgi:hypothetical protein